MRPHERYRISLGKPKYTVSFARGDPEDWGDPIVDSDDEQEENSDEWIHPDVWGWDERERKKRERKQKEEEEEEDALLSTPPLPKRHHEEEDEAFLSTPPLPRPYSPPRRIFVDPPSSMSPLFAYEDDWVAPTQPVPSLE